MSIGPLAEVFVGAEAAYRRERMISDFRQTPGRRLHRPSRHNRQSSPRAACRPAVG